MDDFPRKLSGLKAESLAALKAEVETRLLAARKQDQRQRAFELNTQRMAIMDALEQVRDETQARKEGARPKQCEHGISMADTCLACREIYYRANEQVREQAQRRGKMFYANERPKQLEWSGMQDDVSPADGTYGAINRQAQLAEYWNQTTPKPGELADVLNRAGRLEAAKPGGSLTRAVYEDALRDAAAAKPGTFGSMFDDVKVRRLQEDAAAAQAKQMVNQRMARYSEIQYQLAGLTEDVKRRTREAGTSVRRAPATVAPGPPMEAKRGYFDE